MSETMKCPQCGNFVKGTPQHEIKRDIARGAIAKGTTWATGAAIGSVVPGIGTFIGGAVGFLAGVFMKDSVISEIAEESMFGAADLEFSCPKCGLEWTCKPYKVGFIQEMQETIAKQLRELRYDVRRGIGLSIISIAIAAGCGYYCFIKNFVSISMQEHSWFWWLKEILSNNWLWILLCVVCVIALLSALLFINQFMSDISDMKYLRNSLIKTYSDNCRIKSSQNN